MAIIRERADREEADEAQRQRQANERIWAENERQMLVHERQRQSRLQAKRTLQEKELQQFHIEKFGHDLPIKPVEGILKVRSQFTVGVKYDVDLDQQTCTCENFRKRRSHPKNHVARWCKHLLKELKKAGAFSTLEGLQAEVVTFSFTQCNKMYLIKHQDLPEMVLTLGDALHSEGWININARKKRTGENIKQASGKFENYGWNLHEKRWSYTDGPAGASLLRPLLVTLDTSSVENLLESCLTSIK